MIASITEIVTYGCTIAITLTSTIIAIVIKVKGAKAKGESAALVALAEIHDLADALIQEIEKSPYDGKSKKDLVIAKCLINFPKLDTAELGDYIDKQVSFSKSVNRREKDYAQNG